MPGFDSRGPEGKGPRTGRGLGRCKDPEDRMKDDDFENFPRGRGRGGFFGFGRGRGRGGRIGFGRGRM